MPKLIKTMTLLGYSPHDSGVCYGIAMMASQAVIRNQSDHFLRRMEFIRNASNEQIKSIAKPFDKEQKGLHDIKVDLCSFFDELSVYHGNKSVNEEFKSLVPNIQNAGNVKNLANAKIDSRFTYPHIKHNVTNSFSHNEFLDLLIKIRDHVPDCSFSVVISHSQISHATQIGFDAKSKQWLSLDHDYLISGKNKPSDIKKVVDNIFIPHKHCYDGEKRLVVSLDIVLSEKIEKEIDLSLLKSNNFSLEHITASFNKEELSHLIQCYEYASRYDDMMAIFDQINTLNLPEQDKVNLLDSKRKNGLTVFHFLAGRGKADTLQALWKKAKEMQLSDTAKISLLAERDKKNASALLVFALNNGYEKKNQQEKQATIRVVKVLLAAIKEIEDEAARAKLLSAKSSEGFPMLLVSAINGRQEIVEAFTKTIVSCINNEKLKADLLAASDDEGISALLMAAENGYTAMAEALIKAICTLKDKQLIVKLLEARDGYGVSALSMAAEKGHAKVIEALTAAICELDNKQMKFHLLESRNRYGQSALLMAIEKKHIEAVKAITTAIGKIEDSQMRAKLLESKNHNSDCALLTAVKKGNKEIVAILLKSIDSIKDNKIKTQLLEAKSNKGLSALSTAIKNGDYQIARLFSSL